MIRMSPTLIADTYAWVEYFSGNRNFKEDFDSGHILTPTVVIAELVRIFVRKKFPKPLISEKIDLIVKKSTILELDLEHAKKGGEIAETEKLHFSDALIYSYASEESFLLTGDEHFKGKKFVKFVK